MNPLPLLDGQSIRICNHHRGCGIPNDINDPSADVHLHKNPNHGRNFHGVIHIPLQGEPIISIENQFNDHHKFEEIQTRLITEVREVFQEHTNDPITRPNFIRELIDILRNNWNDKLDSEERAKDIAQRIGRAFGLENEVENIIRKSHTEKLTQYISIHQNIHKLYFIDIRTEDIRLGEISGRTKIKYINQEK